MCVYFSKFQNNSNMTKWVKQTCKHKVLYMCVINIKHESPHWNVRIKAVSSLQLLYCSPARIKVSLPLRVPALSTAGGHISALTIIKLLIYLLKNFHVLGTVLGTLHSFNLQNSPVKVKLCYFNITDEKTGQRGCDSSESTQLSLENERATKRFS